MKINCLYEIFIYPKFQNIKTINIENKTYFCYNDVIDVLDINTGSNAIVLCRHNIQKINNNKMEYFIDESDIYRLITFYNSDIEEWIMEVVLPSIRETGTYKE